MIKRAFDMAASAAGLLLLLPVLLAVALLVALLLGRPVLFSQVRPGRGGRPFRMVKFRTMTGACDADGKLLPDAERITRFGRFLRASSLDELPELWNVLRGDMSLVGPRPLLVEYLPLYSPEQARRTCCRCPTGSPPPEPRRERANRTGYRCPPDWRSPEPQRVPAQAQVRAPGCRTCCRCRPGSTAPGRAEAEAGPRPVPAPVPGCRTCCPRQPG